MKILIALDGSPHSEGAIQFVTRMRWPAGSRVIVATVIRKQRTHREAITTRAQDQLRAAGLSTEHRIVKGDPREQLLRLIETERADLLVMGLRGRMGVAIILSDHAAASPRVLRASPTVP